MQISIIKHSGYEHAYSCPGDAGRQGSGPTITCLHPAHLSERHLASWRSFQESDPALHSPFLSPELARIAASVRKGATVAVIEQHGMIRGFFPFFRRGRVGQPLVGALDDCQAVIAAPGWAWDARALIRGAGLSAFEFPYLRVSQQPFVPFHRTVVPSHVIDLADGYDAYARERARARNNLLSEISVKKRRLERLGRLSFTFHDPDPRSLRFLMELKRQQYRRTGQRDIFARRWVVSLVERVHTEQTASFAGTLSTLSLGGRVIAAHMGMRSAGILHYWFPVFDPEFAKYSPGTILLNELCRASAAAGLRQIELGPGDESYKPRFANTSIPMASGFVGSASAPGLRRRVQAGIEDLAMCLPIGRLRYGPQIVFRRLAERAWLRA